MNKKILSGNKKRVLDACCGAKMFWFDKNNQDVVFQDVRRESHTLCDGRKLVISPDVLADFRNMPYEDECFFLVVFDPPHLRKIGTTSLMGKKYGRLPDDWKKMIREGFDECMRVLKPKSLCISKGIRVLFTKAVGSKQLGGFSRITERRESAVKKS